MRNSACTAAAAASGTRSSPYAGSRVTGTSTRTMRPLSRSGSAIAAGSDTKSLNVGNEACGAGEDAFVAVGFIRRDGRAGAGETLSVERAGSAGAGCTVALPGGAGREPSGLGSAAPKRDEG